MAAYKEKKKKQNYIGIIWQPSCLLLRYHIICNIQLPELNYTENLYTYAHTPLCKMLLLDSK